MQMGRFLHVDDMDRSPPRSPSVPPRRRQRRPTRGPRTGARSSDSLRGCATLRPQSAVEGRRRRAARLRPPRPRRARWVSSTDASTCIAGTTTRSGRPRRSTLAPEPARLSWRAYTDEVVAASKGSPMMSLAERTAVLEACGSTRSSPSPSTPSASPFWTPTRCGFVAHGDDMPVACDGDGMYAAAIEAGRFRLARTAGTSTTAIIDGCWPFAHPRSWPRAGERRGDGRLRRGDGRRRVPIVAPTAAGAGGRAADADADGRDAAAGADADGGASVGLARPRRGWRRAGERRAARRLRRRRVGPLSAGTCASWSGRARWATFAGGRVQRRDGGCDQGARPDPRRRTRAQRVRPASPTCCSAAVGGLAGHDRVARHRRRGGGRDGRTPTWGGSAEAWMLADGAGGRAGISHSNVRRRGYPTRRPARGGEGRRNVRAVRRRRALGVAKVERVRADHAGRRAARRGAGARNRRKSRPSGVLRRPGAGRGTRRATRRGRASGPARTGRASPGAER